jgi:ATP-dependent Clp protease ATP-binding subunit ClpA
MFERFDEQARAAVAATYEKATALGHNYLGTEHLLFGLIAAPNDVSDVLIARGASRQRVQAEVISIVGCASTSALDRDDASALATIGIDLDEVRRRVEAAFGPGALSPSPEQGRRRRRRTRWRKRDCSHLETDELQHLGHRRPVEGRLISLGTTPRTKRSIELATRWSVQRGDTHVAAGHLLLGLLSLEEGLAVEILDRIGVDRVELRQAVLDRLGPHAA